MPDITKSLLEKYESKRAIGPSVEAPEPDPQQQSYRQAAAVLHCFVPEALQPLAPDLCHPRPRLLLFDDIAQLAGGWSEGLFTLKLDVRRRALRELSSLEAMRQALLANPTRAQTSLQEMWEGYLLKGSVPPLEDLGYRQLTNLYQIVSWLDGLDKNLPDEAQVLDLVRRKSVLASFEHLVSTHFTGRTAELAMLREHVGALPPATGIRAIRRQLAQWVNVSRKPILVIHGPGGIGKSALIGRMLLEYAVADPQARIPFAYLAFDDPSLRIETPFTILVEAAAQFKLQFPEQTAAIEDFNDIVRKFRDARGALGTRKVVTATRGERIGEVHALDRQLYLDFAEMLIAIGARTLGKEVVRSPVLLVLDTFEEVQYRDQESLTGFWRMLDIIQEAYPSFRVVISGRTSIAELGFEKRNLEERLLSELAVVDRVTLLKGLGVADPTIAQTVAEQVGGNPLSLRLAASVITTDPQASTAKGIKDLTTRRWLFFQVDEQLIQGQLYRRILDQIHDENVRKLAHPGMVLRRVSPEVILEVLAPLCDIFVSGLAEAETLFEELRREHALVQAGDEGTLIYRPEIRRAMIRLLEQDKFGGVRELHRAAIAYYSRKDTVAARAEELYHRLVLDEDEPWSLDSRWMDGIEQSIAANLEEYPDRAKAWLASRMNLEVPRSVFASANTAEWERNTTRKVKRALSELQTQRALALLGERPDRSDASPLFALEAKTYLLENDLNRAWAVLERGVERVSTSTNRGRLAELFWLQSQVALLRSQPDLADQLLEYAQRVIENGRNPLPLMHVLCHRLLLRDKFPAAYPETAPQLRLRLNSVCEHIHETTAFSSLFVVQLALSLLKKEFPKTTERLALLVQYDFQPSGDPLTSENLQGLDEYRESWENEDNPSPEAAA